MPKLTAKQERFIEEYLIDLNACAAAARAGYGRNRHSTSSISGRLMTTPHIKAEIAARKAKITEQYDVTKGRILKELAAIAFADPRKLYDESGNLKPIGELDDEAAASIAAIDVEFDRSKDGKDTVTGTRRIKRYDKNAALSILAKYRGLLTDKVELTGRDGEPLVEKPDPFELARRVAFVFQRALTVDAEDQKP